MYSQKMGEFDSVITTQKEPVARMPSNFISFTIYSLNHGGLASMKHNGTCQNVVAR